MLVSCTHMIVFVLGGFDSLYIYILTSDLDVFTLGCGFGTGSSYPARGS